MTDRRAQAARRRQAGAAPSGRRPAQHLPAGGAVLLARPCC